MKQRIVLLSLIVFPLLMLGCSSQEPSKKPSGFFGGVHTEYPRHPGVIASQIYEFSPYTKENKELHVSGIIEKEILEKIDIFSGYDSPLEIDIHLFDTVEIEVGKKQVHTMHVKGSILYTEDTSTSFESDLYLITEEASSQHFIFIDNFSYQHIGDVPYLFEFWTSFISSQKKKRINMGNTPALSHLNSGRLFKKIDANMKNSRIMQGLDSASIFSSEGEELHTELEILDEKEVITFNFINEKTLLVLTKTGSIYTIDGDIQSDLFGGYIQGTGKAEGGSDSIVFTSNSSVTFPKGLEIGITTRNNIRSISSLETDLQIPTRYIDGKKILPEK